MSWSGRGGSVSCSTARRAVVTRSGGTRRPGLRRRSPGILGICRRAVSGVALVMDESAVVARSLFYAASVMVAPVRNRSEAPGRLADLAPHLPALGVTSLRVFGSAGRDAMSEDCDVDILVEFDRPLWGIRVPRSPGRPGADARSPCRPGDSSRNQGADSLGHRAGSRRWGLIPMPAGASPTCLRRLR
jgi:hypothetical protein